VASAPPAAAPEATAAVELRGIRASYSGVEVLHGIDLVLPAGSVVALLGPNGAGKTTTLRVVSGLMRPTAGHVVMRGHDVTGARTEQLSRAGVCLVPEGRAIFRNLTVRENLLIDTYGCRRSVSEIEEIAYTHFPRLGERRHQRAGTLSGGEQQMLAVSRALTTDPAVLLIDELSMGLAPVIVDELYEVVGRLRNTGITALVVEQFAATVLGLADHVIVMRQGRVRLAGPPSEVRDRLASVYLGGS
jgi:branched-chain amino acid transport system ATP-binding protein